MGLLQKICGAGSKKQTKKQQSHQEATSGYNFKVIADAFETLEQVQHALRTAGLESSQLILGIDFTKSNEWTGKHSFNGQCLHTVGPYSSNPYEQAISIIAKTLSAFDDDNLIPCYGFGDASTGDHQVFSLFPNNQPARGITSALSRYREIAPQVQLAGPTSFAPLIRQAIRTVVASGMQYHILVILADGQVTPTCLEDTVDAIVEASYFPLSIVMVGVGDGPWETMTAFDDSLPQRKFDNFQFVNFTKCMHEASASGVSHEKMSARFARNALMEIPEQYRAVLAMNLLGRGSRAPRMAFYDQIVLPPPTQEFNARFPAYGLSVSYSAPTLPSGQIMPKV